MDCYTINCGDGFYNYQALSLQKAIEVIIDYTNRKVPLLSVVITSNGIDCLFWDIADIKQVIKEVSI